MKFKTTPKLKHSDLEKEIIKYWKDNNIFQKSIVNRPPEKSYTSIDGPPFATGTPHHGHLLVSTLKDSIFRYQTMQGYRVERQWGWDCHGLPAEVFVEKRLGLTNGKKDIGVKISLKDYVAECRKAMLDVGDEWENFISRLGRWADMSNPYRTMDKEYMESVWWAFSELYKKGKIYDGEKVLLYCPKDATPISKSEVAMENTYQEVTDPSVYVLFKLIDSDEYLLAWTTTPWTLPANVAVAVNPELEYSKVELDGKILILATKLIEKALTNEKHQQLPYKIISSVDIKDYVGKKYHPILENHGTSAHVVLSAPYVSDIDGSGVVHLAPAYGEEDYDLGKKEGIPILSVVDSNGNYSSGRWVGQNIWEVNKEIAKTLHQEGTILKIEYIKHEYPHCHRCGTKLLYRAHPSWFMDIQSQKEDNIRENEKTNWVPKNIQEKRFKNILEDAPDWNLSRDRFWATPIPVWEGVNHEGQKIVKVVGSYEELKDLSGFENDDYHLPSVMDLEFEIDGVKLRHCGKVLDCWFESGSAPFAAMHYPFENKGKFESNFPCDFVTEALDQTRGWFNSLNSVNVGLFGREAYKNLICCGLLMGNDGVKLSKKLQNFTPPLEVFDNISADAFRLFLLKSPVVMAENTSLLDKDVLDVERKLQMLQNSYDFFTMYAEVDGWNSDIAYQNGSLVAPKSNHILDKWILSRLESVIKNTTDNMDAYNLPKAVIPMIDLLDDLSNWYIRRSRSRFWKTEDDDDKNNAYHTLYFVLVNFCLLLSPFSPFLTEYLFRKLTGKESVHLEDYPKFDKELQDDKLESQMLELRELITTGLAIRAKAGIKVRQPLSSTKTTTMSEELKDILKDELNVKTIITSDSNTGIELDLDITPDLKSEGLAREVIRVVQNARKNADLNINDRINLNLITDSLELKESIESNKDLISRETLTKELSLDSKDQGFKEDVKFEDINLTIIIS